MLQKKTARCEASQIQVVKYLILLVALVHGTDLTKSEDILAGPNNFNSVCKG